MSRSSNVKGEQVDDITWRRKFKEGWLLPLQAAKRWNVAESTIYKWIKQGKVSYIQSVTSRVSLLDPKQPKP